jgi:DNA-binding MarR family transcriptional regulator
MADDIVEIKGYLTLGSRFKRIGERLQADATRIFKAEGVEVPSALWPTLATLDRHGELTIGALAESLGIAQPGATRNVAQLEKLGLVRRRADARDQRLKAVTLTEEGAGLVRRSEQIVWPRIVSAVAEICDGLDGPLLSQLAVLERELARKPLDQRARRGDAP